MWRGHLFCIFFWNQTRIWFIPRPRPLSKNNLDRNQTAASDAPLFSLTVKRMKKTLWMHWLVVNVSAVMSWHFIVDGFLLHDGSVPAHITPRTNSPLISGKNAIVPPTTPSGITKAISSLKVGYTWQTNKEEEKFFQGESTTPLLLPESCSHFCPFMVLRLQIPSSALGFTGRLNSLWPGPWFFSSNAHLKASQVLHDFFFSSLWYSSIQLFFLSDFLKISSIP